MNFRAQINEALGKLSDKVLSWLDATILLLPNLLIAILVMGLFGVVGWMVKRFVPKALSKLSDNRALNRLMGSIASMTVLIIGLFVALSIMNLDKTVTSLLAGVGVVGIALGFAFQNSAANFISGVIMAFKYPVKVGDLIETNGVFGKVEKIGIRYIVMSTPQGQKLAIPNRKVLEEILENYTMSGERRIDLECGISYGDDLERVRRVATQAIGKLPFIDKNREVEFYYTGFGDSSINFRVQYWIDYSCQPDFLQARSEGIIKLKKAFDNNEITIPFPIRTLDFDAKGGIQLSEQFDMELLKSN